MFLQLSVPLLQDGQCPAQPSIQGGKHIKCKFNHQYHPSIDPLFTNLQESKIRSMLAVYRRVGTSINRISSINAQIYVDRIA